MSQYTKEWTKNFIATLKNMPPDGIIMKVPFHAIVRDDSFNARTSPLSATQDELASDKYKATSTQQGAQLITEMADQLRRDGLLSPLIVRPLYDEKGIPNGKLFLVAGFRRHAAIDVLKWEDVTVNIKEMSESQSRIVNLAENVARKDLKPYEVAMRMKLLRDEFSMPMKTVGAQLNFSQTYVSFLTNILEKCHPRLLRLWADPKWQPVLTVDNLVKWSKLSSDEQIQAFEDVRVSKNLTEDGEPGPEKTPEEKAAAAAASAGRIKAPPSATIKDALARAESGVKGKSKDYQTAMVAALRWVLGETGSLDGWYDPAAEKEKIAKREKMEKLAAKRAKDDAELAKLQSELAS